MDLLSVGCDSTDVILCQSDGLQHEIDLLSDFSQKVSSGGISPPYSEVSCADSGVSSPLDFNGGEMLLELFGEDVIVQPPKTTTSVVHKVQPKSLMSSTLPKCSKESESVAPVVFNERKPASPAVVNQKQEERNRKNAIAARMNRQKKKEYVSELESSVSSLSSEKAELKSKCSRLEQTVEELKTEVGYLRSVLVNQSSLSTLLRNIPGISEVRLSSSLARGKHVRTEELVAPSGSPAFKRPRTQSSFTGGVCLHVADKNVSIEFCSKCNASASQCNACT